ALRLLLTRRSRRPTLFPYTTLFRSRVRDSNSRRDDPDDGLASRCLSARPTLREKKRPPTVSGAVGVGTRANHVPRWLPRPERLLPCIRCPRMSVLPSVSSAATLMVQEPFPHRQPNSPAAEAGNGVRRDVTPSDAGRSGPCSGRGGRGRRGL